MILLQPARSAKAKARRNPSADDLSVQSFRDWLKDLATIVKNRIQSKLNSIAAFEKITRPTPAQRRVLDPLGVSI